MPSQSDAGRRDRRSLAEVVAAVAGLLFFALGVAAFVAPAAFFEGLAAFEPYNAHLIRDIGAFQVGLGLVLLAAVRINDALVASLSGVGAGASLHAVGHVLDRDLGGRPLLDIPLLGIMGLVLLVVGRLRWRSITSGRARTF